MGTKRKQLPGTERKTQLLDAGAKLAAKLGAANVTRRLVAKEAKVAEALVSHYLGGTDEAQAAYIRHARKLGFTLPNKAETAAIGLKMRKHKPGDKRYARRRSVREVEAIKRDTVKPIVTMPRERKEPKMPPLSATNTTMRATKPAPGPASTKPAAPRERKPTAPPARPAPGPTEHKTAARAPKAAPPNLQ